MRVIAGQYKGFRFSLPSSAQIRPTSERVREAVFSTLGSMLELQGTRVLDLYAGSGAFGIEALSRGVQHCTFVEANKQLGQSIEVALVALKSCLNADVVISKVERYLNDFAMSELCQSKTLLDLQQARFDIVFADPPYAKHLGDELVRLIVTSGVVIEGSVLVIESANKTRFSNNIEVSSVVMSNNIVCDGKQLYAECISERGYGDSSVWYFRVRAKDE